MEIIQNKSFKFVLHRLHYVLLSILNGSSNLNAILKIHQFDIYIYIYIGRGTYIVYIQKYESK